MLFLNGRETRDSFNILKSSRCKDILSAPLFTRDETGEEKACLTLAVGMTRSSLACRFKPQGKVCPLHAPPHPFASSLYLWQSCYPFMALSLGFATSPAAPGKRPATEATNAFKWLHPWRGGGEETGAGRQARNRLSSIAQLQRPPWLAVALA